MKLALLMRLVRFELPVMSQRVSFCNVTLEMLPASVMAEPVSSECVTVILARPGVTGEGGTGETTIFPGRYRAFGV